MDKRGVKFAKGGKPVPTPSQGLPSLSGSKGSSNGNGNGAAAKSRPEGPTRSTALPSITNGSMGGPPPSDRGSRKMSASESVPQVAEFIYSKAVELALRKYGFWSSRPLPKGYRPRYLEAEITSLSEIYEDHVFMRKTSKSQRSARPQMTMDDFRPARAVSRSYPEVHTEPVLPAVTPSRDTPMPKGIRAGAVSRFPSIAVEFRVPS